ncbi:hypothetical protein FBQ81_06350 [Chloroflexi bacterium CFX6]|nr:hypothetical protein [Chloroflexi bacterium CFX6]
MNNTSFRRQIAKLCIVFVLICLTVTNINPIPNAGAQEGGQPTPQPNSIPPTPTPTSASDTSEQKNELERQSLDNVMEALVPTNDDFSFATPILGDLYSDILDTTGATVASDDPYMGCGYGINSNTVWYRFTTPSAGKLRANTIGSNYDTVIAVFTGLRGSLVPIICNDDYSGLQSQIEFQVQAGQTYYLEVADYGSPGGGLLQLTVDFIHIDVPLDIVLLQDETGSMYDDIAQLQSLAPQTWDSINEVSTAGFRMSVVGFKDFARTPWGDGSDWVYRLLTDFVTDRNQFVASVNALTAYGGNDGPESQYAAANYLLASNHPCIDSNGNGNCLDFFDTPIGQQPHFRSGARRIILLATDASFHDPTNTPGYPGPSRDVVADKLLANRVIVIGLVPGGEGYVPQVDDLATLTGGSTQNTGSTGGDIANAIAIALGRFRPVSSVLSTVTVTPNTVLADGNATALVTVTLRDTANMPVAGKSVILISTRGGQDIIYQPVTQTDINGQTTGLIASLSSGDSNIIAVDVTDSVQIAQQPLIQFTPDNQELLNKINRFNSTTQIQLSNLESSVKQVGKDGDEMKRFIAEDRASIAINIFNMFWGTYKGVKEINRLRAGVQLALPGLTDAGYDVIENFVRGYPESGDLFNLTWRQAIQTENFESLILQRDFALLRDFDSYYEILRFTLIGELKK